MPYLFGLTYLGDPNPLQSKQLTQFDFEFGRIDKQMYMNAFYQNCIGDSNLAKTLQIDGQSTILRKNLINILREILGQQPNKDQYLQWCNHLDQDSSAIMTAEEFGTSVDNLIASCRAPADDITYSSYTIKTDDWQRHKRYAANPVRKLNEPLSTQQAVGWDVVKNRPATKRYALSTTDVTKGEGKTLADYYGEYVMLGA